MIREEMPFPLFKNSPLVVMVTAITGSILFNIIPFTAIAKGGVDELTEEIDLRNFSYQKPSDSYFLPEHSEFKALSLDRPVNDTVSAQEYDPFTGSYKIFKYQNPPAQEGNLIGQALDFAIDDGTVSGWTGSEQHPEYIVDTNIQQTSAGQKIVHLQQTYHSIPVFQTSKVVIFDSENRIQSQKGATFSPEPGMEPKTIPELSVEKAMSIASNYGVQLSNGRAKSEKEFSVWSSLTSSQELLNFSNFSPEVYASFSSSPTRQTVFHKGPFDEPPLASLTLLNLGGEVRLGWEIFLVLPDGRESLLVIVAATENPDSHIKKGQILYSKVMDDGVEARGLVFHTNPSEDKRKWTEFIFDPNTQPVSSPVSLPTSSHSDWVLKDETAGNYSEASWNNQTTKGSQSEGSNTILFEPDYDDNYDEFNGHVYNGQVVLNAFFFVNRMHDFFYLLGFDESAGNFQKENYTGNGEEGDPVKIEIKGSPKMISRPDGQSPTMRLGKLITGRHTGLSADVVMHEYTHGVSNRLVGGPKNVRALQGLQSKGMGEGWGDYFALTYQNYDRNQDAISPGIWVAKKPKGVRGYPYNENFPDGFGKLGKGRYGTPHNIGEIWCAILMKMNRELGQLFENRKRGHELGWQLVVDSMKLMNSEPSFLDGRNAIFEALKGLKDKNAPIVQGQEHKDIARVVWKAFSKFGMGPNASSLKNTVQRIVADTSDPKDVFLDKIPPF